MGYVKFSKILPEKIGLGKLLPVELNPYVQKQEKPFGEIAEGLFLKEEWVAKTSSS